MFLGTKGRCATILAQQPVIEGENPWHFTGEEGNMYELEHEALFAAIRAGKPINNGLYMARSTMLAILGRMVDYTGQAITWDQAINSKQVLAPRVRLGRRAADHARQGRPLPGGHAGRDEAGVTERGER